MSKQPTYHYGDFPELFWDAELDAVIDTTHPEVIARVLQKGRPEHIRELLDLVVLRSMWDTLWLPDHTRYVWEKVLVKTSRSGR